MKAPNCLIEEDGQSGWGTKVLVVWLRGSRGDVMAANGEVAGVEDPRGGGHHGVNDEVATQKRTSVYGP